MTAVFDGVHTYAQHYPFSFATGLIVVLPGTYLYATGTAFSSAFAPFILSPAQSSIPNLARSVLAYSWGSSPDLAIPVSISSDRATATFAHRAIESTRDNINFIDSIFEDRIGSNVRHWILHFPFSRALSLATTAALPGLFLLFVHQFPDSQASKHQTTIANVLHFIVLASFGYQGFDVCGLLVAAIIMVAFDVFQHVLGRTAADATNGDESEHQPKALSAVETLLVQNRSIVAKSDFAPDPKGVKSTSASQPGVSNTKPAPTNSKDREIVRLQRTLTELRTVNKAKEVLLRSVKDELYNAREALNETFTEYTSLREELATVKQTLGKDHQAIVYRKEIELFALRKGNEQKEKYIKERDAKLDAMHRQHTATIEVKDTQLKLLKDRLVLMDRQASWKSGHDNSSEEDGDHALEVRLLRVKKGRTSPEAEEQKDVTIAKLQEQLAVATKAAEAVVNQQAELQRAWDVTKKIQNALKEERELHIQTREQLQEITVKLSEEESQKKSRPNSIGRLPTIDEDEQDTKELEAMFDTAQEDNLRLYAEVDALEKRLRDANSRMFTAEQDAEALREQVRIEKAINQDMETARPSVVHRVHFQRFEGQLKESQDTITAKEEEIERLKITIAEKNHRVEELQREVDAAIEFHTQDQDEVERLKQYVAELQATKEQLMLDHEHLALQRTRQRVVSADRTSARSSGVTLIQESSPHLTKLSDEPAPVEALPPMPTVAESNSNESVQQTPKTHSRSESTPVQWTVMSTNQPPPELRDVKVTRRRSLGLKGLMKRIVRKDTDADKAQAVQQSREDTTNEQEPTRMKRALAPKDKNAPLGPKTAAPANTAIKAVVVQGAVHTPTTAPVPQAVRPSTSSRMSISKHPTTQKENEGERPQTATADDARRPASRRSWAATNKLKRRSLM